MITALLLLSSVISQDPADDPGKRAHLLGNRIEAESKDERETTLRELIEIGNPALPVLERLSASKNDELKERAIYALGRIRWGARLCIGSWHALT